MLWWSLALLWMHKRPLGKSWQCHVAYESLYPLPKPELIHLKGFFPQGIVSCRKYVLKEWRIFLRGMLLHADLKLINFLTQLGTNHVCLETDGHACASQKWNKRREKSIRFSWAIRKADMKPYLAISQAAYEYLITQRHSCILRSFCKLHSGYLSILTKFFVRYEIEF